MKRNKVYIPGNISKLMAPEDRQALGIRTPEERMIKAESELERDLHHQFSGWLRRNGFSDFYHADPARRSTIQTGLPDFGIFRDSRIVFIEIKVGKNTLSDEQEVVFQRMGQQGNIILVCHSYEQCVKAVTGFFGLNKGA
jgi:hypothetical protein